jgi:hypothetical protein
LIGDDVAGGAIGTTPDHGEGVVGMQLGMRHGQSADQARALVEGGWRQDKQWMHVADFAACLGVEVDSSDIAPTL